MMMMMMMMMMIMMLMRRRRKRRTRMRMMLTLKNFKGLTNDNNGSISVCTWLKLHYIFIHQYTFTTHSCSTEGSKGKRGRMGEESRQAHTIAG